MRLIQDITGDYIAQALFRIPQYTSSRWKIECNVVSPLWAESGPYSYTLLHTWSSHRQNALQNAICHRNVTVMDQHWSAISEEFLIVIETQPPLSLYYIAYSTRSPSNSSGMIYLLVHISAD